MEPLFKVVFLLGGEGDGFSAYVFTLSFGEGDAFSLAFFDEGAFEFCEGSEEVEHEGIGGGGGVGGEGEVFFDELDAGAFLCNVGNDCGEVLEGAGEAVDAVDAEGISFSDVVEGVGKSGAFFP